MYKICGKVKETGKTSPVNCIFCHRLRRLSQVVTAKPWGRREGGKEQWDPCLPGTTQQYPSAFSAVSMSRLWEVVFWELPDAGDPGGARLPLCSKPLGGIMAPISCLCKHLLKITAQGFLQGPPTASSPGCSQRSGWPGASQYIAVESKGNCVQRKVLCTFLKYFVLLPSVPLQDLSNSPAPTVLVSVKD